MDERLRRHEYGFLELASPPDDQALTDYYAQKYYQSEQGNYRKSYPEAELAAIQLRTDLRAHHADQLRGTDQPGRLLDVGCGEGFVLAAYAARGWTVHGIDHSVEGVSMMNPDQLSNVDQGDLFALLDDVIAADTTYDLVWLGNVLEHVRNPVTLLRTLRRLVAPGGLLVATVPNDGSPYQEALLESGAIDRRFWIAVPDHLSYFTPASLTETATRTGWQVRDIQGDFPIDLFLSHPGSNYVRDRTNGPDAHAARLSLETLIGAAGLEAANTFYSALAGVGWATDTTAHLTPSQEHSL